MYVCLCKGVTDHQIKAALQQGATTFREVRATLDVATQCGKCASLTRDIINRELQADAGGCAGLGYSVG
jgi:bacterioferritin-associated ferredoxin